MMEYFKGNDGHVYRQLDSGALHINPDSILINKLSEDDWIDVKNRYVIIPIDDTAFYSIAKPVLDIFSNSHL